jgi:hypothetical protein
MSEAHTCGYGSSCFSLYFSSSLLHREVNLRVYKSLLPMVHSLQYLVAYILQLLSPIEVSHSANPFDPHPLLLVHVLLFQSIDQVAS